MIGVGSVPREINIEKMIFEDQNAHLNLMDRLIGNAERHGEKSVAHDLVRTLEEVLLAVEV